MSLQDTAQKFGTKRVRRVSLGGDEWIELGDAAGTGGFALVRADWEGRGAVGTVLKAREGKDKKNMISNETLLRKAGPLDSGDFSSDSSQFGTKGPLSVEQMKAFLRILAADTAMLPVVRTVTSNAAKWQESVIESGGRILRQGVGGTVGAAVKPVVTGIEISTQFLKAVVTVTEEAYEDAAASDLDDATKEVVVTQAGFDVEEFMLGSSSAPDASLNDGDPILELTAGWLERFGAGPGSGAYDATADGQDYQTILLALLTSIPSKFKRNKANWNYWVPVLLEEKYRDILSARGTPLGDMTLEGEKALKYQGVSIRGVPAMFIEAGSPDKSHILLAGNSNLYAGYQRQLSLVVEKVAREGQAYYVLTVRCAPQIAIKAAGAVAENVNVEP